MSRNIILAKETARIRERAKTEYYVDIARSYAVHESTMRLFMRRHHIKCLRKENLKKG